MSESINLSRPSSKIQEFNRLIGTWNVTGGAEGTVTYKWMEGGFFIIQDVDLVQYGTHIKGIEIIGHLHPFGEDASEGIFSRFYDNQGNTFDYEYELEGDEMIIWAGAKGSPAFFKGTFTEDGKKNSGSWVYTDGNGYDSEMSLIKN